MIIFVAQTRQKCNEIVIFVYHIPGRVFDFILCAARFECVQLQGSAVRNHVCLMHQPTSVLDQLICLPSLSVQSAQACYYIDFACCAVQEGHNDAPQAQDS